MKKSMLNIVAVAILGVTAVTFHGCKKDPAEIANKTRVMGNVSGDELREFENYTPDETIIEDKLLMINNCVNDPVAYPMPNMELKEAVWFLEAYFNLGVCRWQEYSCEYADKKETYSIEIPHANGWEEEEDVFLDGQQLQSAYRTLLQNIVADICPEYAINFGDVFVQDVNEDGVTLGLEICYGQKCGDCKPIEDPYPCSGHMPYRGTLIATDMSTTAVKYPTDLPNPYFKYFANNFRDSEVKDTGMTNVLMQKRIMQVPMGIRKPDLWAYTNGTSLLQQHYFELHVYTAGGYVDFDIDFYNYNSQIWSYDYGTTYRNHIWNVLLPQAVAQGLTPAGSIPLEVECKLKHATNISLPTTGTVWHSFGLVRTCTYFVNPCFMYNDDVAFVP